MPVHNSDRVQVRTYRTREPARPSPGYYSAGYLIFQIFTEDRPPAAIISLEWQLSRPTSQARPRRSLDT